MHNHFAAVVVICEGVEHHRYQRLVAVCRARVADLGEALIAAGPATVYRRFPRQATGARSPPARWPMPRPRRRRAPPGAGCGGGDYTSARTVEGSS